MEHFRCLEKLIKTLETKTSIFVTKYFILFCVRHVNLTQLGYLLEMNYYQIIGRNTKALLQIETGIEERS